MNAAIIAVLISGTVAVLLSVPKLIQELLREDSHLEARLNFISSALCLLAVFMSAAYQHERAVEGLSISLIMLSLNWLAHGFLLLSRPFRNGEQSELREKWLTQVCRPTLIRLRYGFASMTLLLIGLCFAGLRIPVSAMVVAGGISLLQGFRLRVAGGRAVS